MAAVAAASDADNEKKARRLQELFRGRFSEKEALAVILDKDGDLFAAVDFVMKGNPQQVRRFIHDRDETLVRELQRDTTIVNKHLRNGLPYTIRQFGCGRCDNSWWRKVPARKEVSSCNKCKTKYDPVPRDREWGWGIFHCQCGNIFGGFGEMSVPDLTCPCFKCHTLCQPIRIKPPSGKPTGGRRRSDHMCSAPDCYNAALFQERYGRFRGRGNRIARCVHPRSIRANGGPIVRCRRQPHRSTGSTVATFLTQDDMVSYAGSFVSNLADVQEDDAEAGSDDNSNSDGTPADDGH